jgi:cytochrome c peroxidase
LNRKVLKIVLTLLFSLVFITVAQAGYLIPPVPYPLDNPQTPEKVILGEKLFFDPNLSNPPGISCASCHNPIYGFGDNKAFSIGVYGREGTRNSPSIYNTAYNKFQFWDGRASSLEEQALGPIKNPVEMNNTLENVIKYLNDPSQPNYNEYQSLFKQAFNGEISALNIAKAIAAYERTILAFDTPYDRYLQGNSSAISESAKKGESLFFGKARCNDCHTSPLFSDNSFHNIGVPLNPVKPVNDNGRYDVTKKPEDMGKFKTPTLRNAGLTPPYMHNGVFNTFQEVIDFYSKGSTRMCCKNGSSELRPCLSKQEKADLVEFLKALTKY